MHIYTRTQKTIMYVLPIIISTGVTGTFVLPVLYKYRYKHVCMVLPFHLIVINNIHDVYQ
jgi:hypothetical protein